MSVTKYVVSNQSTLNYEPVLCIDKTKIMHLHRYILLAKKKCQCCCIVANKNGNSLGTHCTCILIYYTAACSNWITLSASKVLLTMGDTDTCCVSVLSGHRRPLTHSHIFSLSPHSIVN